MKGSVRGQSGVYTTIGIPNPRGQHGGRDWHDEYGRVTNKLDQTATQILRYTYDADSRLSNRWSVAKGTTIYGYDPVGNLLNSGIRAFIFSWNKSSRVTSYLRSKLTRTCADLCAVQFWRWLPLLPEAGSMDASSPVRVWLCFPRLPPPEDRITSVGRQRSEASPGAVARHLVSVFRAGGPGAFRTHAVERSPSPRPSPPGRGRCSPLSHIARVVLSSSVLDQPTKGRAQTNCEGR